MESEVVIKSYRIKEKYLKLYSDKEGEEMEVAIPLWLLDQIIEGYLGIKIK